MSWFISQETSYFARAYSFRRKGGRPSLTWINLVEKDLELVDIKIKLKDKGTLEEKNCSTWDFSKTEAGCKN